MIGQSKRKSTCHPEWRWCVVRNSSKDIAQMAIFASLYAVLVWLFQPISFYELQFRVADILPPAIAKKWKLAIAYGIGCVAANLVSPFAGAWELLFTPFMSFSAGLIGYLAARVFKRFDYYICGAVHAVVISLAVSYMLEQVLYLPMTVTFIWILVSELILGFIGATVFTLIERRFGEWWK
jgi:uncharacterized membrane protein